MWVGIAWKEPKGNFWENGNILFLDLGGDYMCTNSPSYTLKICSLYEWYT